MSRKCLNDITRIVRLAEAEGLSYGRYVAQERAIRTQRRPPILDTAKPRGISTIQAALRVDCPGLCANSRRLEQHKPPKAPEPRPLIQTRCENDSTDETEVPYKRNSTGCKGLSTEKIVRIRALRAQGETYRNIAIECDVSCSSVRKYLKEG